MKSVYVIEAIGSDCVKVGTADDVEKRVAYLQCGNHLPLRVAFFVEHPRASRIERITHSRLKSRRAIGGTEWFRVPVDEATRVIREVVAEPPPKKRVNGKGVEVVGGVTIKTWANDEVIELVDRAGDLNISKGSFAKDWLGVHPTTLSYWMSESDSYREPTDTARRLLTFVEKEIQKREDVR